MNLILHLKELIRREYKKEFTFWIISVFCFIFSFLFLTREIKTFLLLTENLKRTKESYYRIQSEIIRLREKLALIDLNKPYSKEINEITLTLDSRNIENVISSISGLRDKDRFFILKELTFKAEKSENTPIGFPINIKGELITFR